MRLGGKMYLVGSRKKRPRRHLHYGTRFCLGDKLFLSDKVRLRIYYIGILVEDFFSRNFTIARLGKLVILFYTVDYIVGRIHPKHKISIYKFENRNPVLHGLLVVDVRNDTHFAQFFGRALCFGVELTDFLNLVVVEIDTIWLFGTIREHIDKASAHSKTARFEHKVVATEIPVVEHIDKFFHRQFVADSHIEGIASKFAGADHFFHHSLWIGDDDESLACGVKSRQHLGLHHDVRFVLLHVLYGTLEGTGIEHYRLFTENSNKVVVRIRSTFLVGKHKAEGCPHIGKRGCHGKRLCRTSKTAKLHLCLSAVCQQASQLVEVGILRYA